MFATMAPSPDKFVLRHQQKPPPHPTSNIISGLLLQSVELSAFQHNSTSCREAKVNNSQTMSASQLTRLSASAGGLLTNEECYMLLDIDIFNDDDLLKNFPSAAKSEVAYHHVEASVSLYPPSPVESKPSPAELASDLLQQLESQCKQENLFPNWLEEKVDLPIFDSISQGVERVEPSAPGAVPVPAPALYVTAAAPAPAPHTEELLREFETVYGAVELTHLTPPQSPPGPGPATQLLLSYAQQAQGVPPEPWNIQPLQLDYTCTYEEAGVDELVRHRAAHLPSPQPSLGSLSPSPPSSPRSSSTDEESSSSGRAKPYARHPEDRRSRKKEQNKNAATRYRQKKKAEIEVLLGEEATLRQRHGDLGDKCSDLQREIRYLKGLMRDLFKAKGLIK